MEKDEKDRLLNEAVASTQVAITKIEELQWAADAKIEEVNW